MKTNLRYILLVAIAAGVAAAVYEIGSRFIPAGWPKILLLAAIVVAWGFGFARWFWAVVFDPRDPLAASKK